MENYKYPIFIGVGAYYEFESILSEKKEVNHGLQRYNR